MVGPVIQASKKPKFVNDLRLETPLRGRLSHSGNVMLELIDLHISGCPSAKIGRPNSNNPPCAGPTTGVRIPNMPKDFALSVFPSRNIPWT